MNTLEQAFRELRDRWFWRHLARFAHERDWDDQERQPEYDEENEELKKKYDEQTELIISGEKAPLAPTCSYDMDKKE